VNGLEKTFLAICRGHSPYNEATPGPNPRENVPDRGRQLRDELGHHGLTETLRSITFKELHVADAIRRQQGPREERLLPSAELHLPIRVVGPRPRPGFCEPLTDCVVQRLV
jgi:hypothetical protein